MQSVSQEVQIDSIYQTTTLDKKATIAQGNIVKQRDTLLSLYEDQSVLVDSLRLEVSKRQERYQDAEKAFEALKFAYRENEILLQNEKDRNQNNSELHKVEMKALRQKRLGFGAYGGYGISDGGQGFSVGVGLTWTLFRF